MGVVTAIVAVVVTLFTPSVTSNVRAISPAKSSTGSYVQLREPTDAPSSTRVKLPPATDRLSASMCSGSSSGSEEAPTRSCSFIVRLSS